MALLASDRRSTLYGKVFLADAAARAVRLLVIGKDDDALTAELADGPAERGARIGLDGLGFFQVIAIVRTQRAGGERVYLRLRPSPHTGA